MKSELLAILMQSGVSSLVDVGVHLLRVFISKICLVGMCPS